MIFIIFNMQVLISFYFVLFFFYNKYNHKAYIYSFSLLFQVEHCDASVSYDIQLLLAHVSPLDLKIASFLGSNFCMGLNF